MADLQAVRRRRTIDRPEPAVEGLKAAALARRGGRPIADGRMLGIVMRHADAIEAGRPSVSPVKVGSRKD
jgi:hypothetical protein